FDVIVDVRMLPLIRARDSFADHKSGATFQVAFGSIRKSETCATWNCSIILIFRGGHDRQPLGQQACLVTVVRDANLAGHFVARIYLTTAKKFCRAANARVQRYRSSLSLP